MSMGSLYLFLLKKSVIQCLDMVGWATGKTSIPLEILCHSSPKGSLLEQVVEENPGLPDPGLPGRWSLKRK